MSRKYYLKRVERKTGRVDVVDSYEDYGDAIENMEDLKAKNQEKYGYYITTFC